MNEIIQPHKTARGVKYGFDFTLRGIRIRRRGFVSYDEAYSILTAIRMDIFKGNYSPDKYFSTFGGDMTFGSFYENEYLRRVENKIKPTTLYTRKSCVKFHILPVFKDFKLRAIDSKRIKTFFSSKMAEGLATGTIVNIWRNMKSVLKEAVEAGLLEEVPQYQPPSIRNKVKRILTKNEVIELFDALETFKNRPEVNSIISLMFWTGMRIGEARALRISDLDLDAKTIRISRQKSALTGEITSTKTGSIKVIPIHPQLMSEVKTQIKRAEDINKKFNQDTDWLFVSSTTGTILDRTPITRRLKRAALKAFGENNAKGISPHSLRRSIASILVDTGMPIDSVASFLRHDTNTLMTYYNKANDDAFRNRFDEFKINESE